MEGTTTLKAVVDKWGIRMLLNAIGGMMIMCVYLYYGAY